MKRTLFGLLVAFSANLASAQNYWQQEIEYQISVKLDDVHHTLSGYEIFTYHNNSPQALDSMMIHVWPNAYRDKHSALAKQLYGNGEQELYFGADSLKGGIDSLDFRSNGQAIKWAYDATNADIVVLYFSTPIPAGGQMTISTPFKVKIPSGEISRLGHVGQSYQITQWYPKPAVYDKHGWNAIPYLNQGEFYSEYGSYDVSITIPENYVVGATGDIQTPSEEEFLNKKAMETAQNIDSYSDKSKRNNAFPPSSTTWKTIRYTQNKVHDFAWFADKRYLVLKGEVYLPHSNRKVTSWSMFTPKNAVLWKNSIEYINDGTFYYSKWNGDYPYNQVTAVDGTISAGGGMEYPNVTVIGNSSSAIELEIVIVHEVGHNWFYGILGSNERVHGWMDEGMNTLNELRYMYTKYPNNTNLSDMVLDGKFHFDHLSHYDMSDISYKMIAKLGEDQPIETHSAEFTSANYGAVMYMKTGLVFNYLKEYLGEEQFDKCMQAYFEKWKFKHPEPEDMKQVLESVSGKDLSWLFGDLIQTTKHLDARLCSVKSKEGNTTITVANKGQVAGPIEVTGYVDGKPVKTEWVDPTTEKTSLNWPIEVDMVKVNASHREPEMNSNNNYWDKSGLFKKMEPLKLEGLIGDNEADKTNVFWTPAVAGNHYDGFMLGLLLHNSGIPFNRFQYLVAPMYSFGGQRVSGIAELSMTFLPSHTLKTSRFGVSVKSFKNDTTYRGNDGYYFAVQPYWLAKLGNRKKASPIMQTLLVQTMYRLDVMGPSQRELVGGYLKYDFVESQTDYKFGFQLRSDYLANAVNGDAFGRSSAEVSFKYRYMKKKDSRWVELRSYTGSNWNFDMYNSGSAYNYTLSLAGTSGSQDVFLEDYFFGRSEQNGFYSQQRLDNTGAFKSTSSFGTTSRWISTLNFYGQIPVGPSILGVFADYGWFENALNGQVMSAYNAGLAVRLSNIFGVYFPVVYSKELADATYGSGNYGSRIRFTLRLNLIKQPLNINGLI